MDNTVDTTGGRLLEQPTTFAILGCAIEVHRTLGPGLLENAYRRCLTRALERKGLSVDQEVPVSISYHGEVIEGAFRESIDSCCRATRVDAAPVHSVSS